MITLFTGRVCEHNETLNFFHICYEHHFHSWFIDSCRLTFTALFKSNVTLPAELSEWRMLQQTNKLNLTKRGSRNQALTCSKSHTVFSKEWRKEDWELDAKNLREILQGSLNPCLVFWKMYENNSKIDRLKSCRFLISQQERPVGSIYTRALRAQHCTHVKTTMICACTSPNIYECKTRAVCVNSIYTRTRRSRSSTIYFHKDVEGLSSYLSDLCTKTRRGLLGLRWIALVSSALSFPNYVRNKTSAGRLLHLVDNVMKKEDGF